VEELDELCCAPDDKSMGRSAEDLGCRCWLDEHSCPSFRIVGGIRSGSPRGEFRGSFDAIVMARSRRHQCPLVAPVRMRSPRPIALYDLSLCSRASRCASRESVRSPWKAEIPRIIIHIITTIIRMQNRATIKITSLVWCRRRRTARIWRVFP
jgi:uncharacterized integral membrane protein